MCEYCGCQALTAIGDLTEEHDAVVALIGRATAALRRGGLASAAPFVERIVRLLEPHTSVEEQGLFPALAEDFGLPIVRLTAEHRAIDDVLRRVGDAHGGEEPVTAQRLTDTFHDLREHILAEQDGAFPAALATLGPDQWAAVDEIRRRVGSLVSLAPASPPPNGMSISRV